MKTTITIRPPVLRLLAALLFLCFLAPMASGQSNSPTLTYWKDHLNGVDKIVNANGGNGKSWDQAILIASAEELAYFAQQVNTWGDISVANKVPNGRVEEDGRFRGYYFALAADIDLSAHYWTPIGRFIGYSFNGNFDGRGHIISGLKVKAETEKKEQIYAGLFGYTEYGILQNIGVHLSAGDSIQANGTQNNMNGTFAGGIAGSADHIRNCYVVGEGTIEANTSTNDANAGGIVGSIGDSLTNCYATVKVKVNLGAGAGFAGGIAGSGGDGSTISNTYATGDVEKGSGDFDYFSGGICGTLLGTLTHSLAVNGEIAGHDSYTNRVVGNMAPKATITSTYASPNIQVNGGEITGGAHDDPNGAPTYQGFFVVHLLGKGDTGWSEAWEDFSGGTHLPQLKIRNQADNGYIPWPDSKQPLLKAEDYLPLLRKPKLYIASPTGGTLTVKDNLGNPVTNGMEVDPGTPLTLAYTENSNYSFEGYLSGSAADQLTSLADNPVNMPYLDYWLSASFSYEAPPTPPPYVPVYYDVSLPEVEGATTDPEAGVYSVEAWDTFRFYLTLDTAYNKSEPVVTTSRNEIIKPRTSDGAYLVKYVRSDVEIFIDGIVRNNPVANDPIHPSAPEPEIWGERSYLCIRLAEGMPGAPVYVFTPSGRLMDTFRSTPGLNRRQLPTGVYIVRVGDMVRKLFVR